MKILIGLISYFITFQLVAQQLTNAQIKDSIYSAYKNKTEFHLTVQSKTEVSGKEMVGFTYQLYKRNNDFYIKYSTIEVFYTSSMVLMVVPDQKMFVIRPLTKEETKQIQEELIYKVNDSVNYEFIKTDKYYSSTIINPTEEIAKMVCYYNMSTFLLERIEYFYHSNDASTAQKTYVNYTYEKIPAGNSYFNTDKYITKTAKGYVPAAAYSSYSISLNDPYEN